MAERTPNLKQLNESELSDVAGGGVAATVRPDDPCKGPSSPAPVPMPYPLSASGGLCPQ